MKRFEFVTRCDTCGRVIKSEHLMKSHKADEPLIVTVGVIVSGIDKTFSDSRNYGDMCKECYDTILLPELKKLQNTPNVHVTVKKRPFRKQRTHLKDQVYSWSHIIKPFIYYHGSSGKESRNSWKL
ncbi:hypothetical protein AALB81_19105 [Lachnospiraceae bacterium 48-33]